MRSIETNKGTYEFKELVFELGVKKIDMEISKQNLLTVKKCFDQYNLTFGLLYGTLLGAIRENNFIEHDEDTDTFILEEDRELLLSTLFELRDLGFEVGRYVDDLLSIVKDGEYIDIYIYKRLNKNTRTNGGYVIDANYLENLVDYKLFGVNFKIPNNAEKLLVILYGNDWRIPDENGKPRNYGNYMKLRNYIKDNFSFLFVIISFMKKKLHV